MGDPNHEPISKKIIINTVLLAVLVVLALILFFVFRGRPTPIL